MYATSDLYQGPYLQAAPDMLVGYHKGYRVSWDCAVGKVTEDILEDNTKAWSGDHCVDPVLVPGVLFANRPVRAAIQALKIWRRQHCICSASKCRSGWKENRWRYESKRVEAQRCLSG